MTAFNLPDGCLAVPDMPSCEDAPEVEPAVACPRCGRECGEFFDPFGYHCRPVLYVCDNCERGDSPDGSRALGPLVFDPAESPEFYQ